MNKSMLLPSKLYAVSFKLYAVGKITDFTAHCHVPTVDYQSAKYKTKNRLNNVCPFSTDSGRRN